MQAVWSQPESENWSIDLLVYEIRVIQGGHSVAKLTAAFRAGDHIFTPGVRAQLDR